MTILPRLGAATGALILALPALAGRPLQTEDAGVLDAGACEIEGVVERVRLDGGTARAQPGGQLRRRPALAAGHRRRLVACAR